MFTLKDGIRFGMGLYLGVYLADSLMTILDKAYSITEGR